MARCLDSWMLGWMHPWTLDLGGRPSRPCKSIESTIFCMCFDRVSLRHNFVILIEVIKEGPTYILDFGTIMVNGNQFYITNRGCFCGEQRYWAIFANYAHWIHQILYPLTALIRSKMWISTSISAFCRNARKSLLTVSTNLHTNGPGHCMAMSVSAAAAAVKYWVQSSSTAREAGCVAGNLALSLSLIPIQSTLVGKRGTSTIHSQLSPH